MTVVRPAAGCRRSGMPATLISGPSLRQTRYRFTPTCPRSEKTRRRTIFSGSRRAPNSLPRSKSVFNSWTFRSSIRLTCCSSPIVLLFSIAVAEILASDRRYDFSRACSFLPAARSPKPSTPMGCSAMNIGRRIFTPQALNCLRPGGAGWPERIHVHQRTGHPGDRDAFSR